MVSQVDNPEVPVALNGSQSHTLLNEQKFKLQSLTNVLKSAYRGQDIEWWDEEEDSEAGSGARKNHNDDYTDDEDGWGSGGGYGDDFEGSGEKDEEDDELIVPVWTANKVPKDNDWDISDDGGGGHDEWNPWPKFPSSGPSQTTQKPIATGGTSSITHLKSRWSVMKAVTTYTLPVVTAYFGGFLTDVPWIFQ